MKKIKVYIDFDGTLVNTSKRMIEMLNDKFHTHHNWKNLKEYNATDLFPNLTQKEVDWVFGNKAFFNKKLEFIENAQEVLVKLEDYFEYEITTLGIPDNHRWKEPWCKENLIFPYTYRALTDFTKKKSPEAIDMSDGIVIDDNIGMLRSTNAFCKILITNGQDVKWNETHPVHDKDIISLATWKEIGDFLEMKILGVNKYEKSHINIR